MVQTIDIDVITKAAKSVKAISELVEDVMDKSDVTYLANNDSAKFRKEFSQLEADTLSGLKMRAAALHALKFQLRQNASTINYLLFEIESLSKMFNTDAEMMNILLKGESHA